MCLIVSVSQVRCDVGNGIRFWFMIWKVLMFRAGVVRICMRIWFHPGGRLFVFWSCVDVRCILYLILYSSSSIPFLLFYSFLSLLFYPSPILFFLFHSSLLPLPIPSQSSILLFLPIPNLPSPSSLPLLSLLFFSPFLLYLPLIPCLSFTGILTPHVLSEWMVEVCRF